MKHLCLSLLFLITWFYASAQQKESGNLKKKFDEAEGFFNKDLYEKAIPYYKSILEAEPDNYQVLFRLGVCYLKSPSEKQLAETCLEKASRGISETAKEGNFKEKNAPVFTWLFLGQAQHYNYKFDSAIASFGKFKKFLSPDDKELLHLVDLGMNWSRNAKELIKHPVQEKIENLGPKINSSFPEHSPVVNADESMLYFTSRRPNTTGGKIDPADNMYYEDIYFATRTDSGWSDVSNIGPPINTPGNDATIGISTDGQKLFIYRDDKGDGNIYSSDLIGDKWSTPVKLNENINSGKWEGNASISPDGNILYFSSERDGGYGGKDIYMSRKLPNGQWAKAMNLGPVINTPDDDDAPLIHPDGKTLYFGSQGHNSMGGFDIFSATLTDSGTWTRPENLGYPVNTTDDDLFYFPSADNKRAYFSSFRTDGFGEKDLYMMTLPERKEAPLAVYTGTVTSIFGGVPEGATITVKDNITGDVVGVYTPNSSTGKYIFILPPGKNYNISYEASGYLFQSDNLDVRDSSSYRLIKSSIELAPVRVGEKIVLKNIFFKSGSSDLQPESKVELAKLEAVLKKFPKITVQINGHTDSQGSEELNLKLSQKRAQTVVDYLAKEGGIDPARMKPMGYGPKKPVAINKNPDGTWNKAGMALNRRFEFEILSVDGVIHQNSETVPVPDNLKPKDK